MVLDQEGRCGCCGDVLGIDPRNICLDHDHDKKRIRKILCRGCNSALGHMKENVYRISKLLEYAKQCEKMRTL